MKLLYVLLLSANTVLLNAQHTQLWLDVNVIKNLNDHWSLTLEGGPRFQLREKLNVFYIRNSLNYKLYSHTTISGGVSYFNYCQQEMRYHEWRPWQGIRTEFKLLPFLSLIQNLRLEERLFNYDEGNAFYLRGRYLVGVNVKLTEKQEHGKRIYVPVYFEIFEDLNDHKSIFINNARIYLGFGYAFGKNRIEIFHIWRDGRNSEDMKFDFADNFERLRLFRVL